MQRQQRLPVSQCKWRSMFVHLSGASIVTHVCSNECLSCLVLSRLLDAPADVLHCWQSRVMLHVWVQTCRCKLKSGTGSTIQSPMLCTFLQDDISGRQQWTFTPAAGGGYTIQVLVGRSFCNPAASFLGTVACNAAANAAPVNLVIPSCQSKTLAVV